MTRRHLFLCVACLGTAAMPLVAADWWHWRGPQQNGVSPEKNLPAKWSPDGENLVWKAPIGCRSTPLILNGRVYLINHCGERETIQERVMVILSARATEARFVSEFIAGSHNARSDSALTGWHIRTIALPLDMASTSSGPSKTVPGNGVSAGTKCVARTCRVVVSIS